MEDKTFYTNPKIDFLFAVIGGEHAPTKQDKFKPIDVVEVLEDGTEEVLKNSCRRECVSAGAMCPTRDNYSVVSHHLTKNK